MSAGKRLGEHVQISDVGRTASRTRRRGSDATAVHPWWRWCWM